MEIYIGFIAFGLFAIGMSILAYKLPESNSQITNEDWHSAYQESDHQS